MSGVLNHLKGYESLYRIISGIDKKLFKEYNIPYCTHKDNDIFFVVISDDATTDIYGEWSGAKSHCLDKGINLTIIVMTVDEYKNWVNIELPYIKDVECSATPKLLESGYFSINGK